MVLSRLWYLVLGLLLGLALFWLMLASSVFDRTAFRFMGEQLAADRQVVGWYLRDDARVRAARLIPISLEPELAKYLTRANDVEEKVPEDVRAKLNTLLRKANENLPNNRAFDALFIVDQHGRVVASFGYDKGARDFELGGYALVADALRGYVRDDTWVLDRMYRVVARPVESDAGQAPLGVVVGAQSVDDRFVREISQRTGAAVAFYLGNQRVASAAPEGFDVSQLEAIVRDIPGLAQDDEYRDKGRSKVRAINDWLGVAYARLPGETWQLEGGYAVARLPVRTGGPFGFFSRADDKDKEQVNFLAIAGLILFVSGIGLALTFWEHTRPLSRFQVEVRRFGQGETTELQASRVFGVFRKLSQELNDGADKLLAKGGAARRAPADLKEVLGELPAQPQMSAFSAPQALPPLSSGAIPQSISTAIAGALPGGAPPPPPVRSNAASSVTNGAVQEKDWRDLYQQFLSIKTECGESVEGMSYDKFEQTLRKSRDAVIKEHGGTAVKFAVYIKAGKAALKCSPLA